MAVNPAPIGPKPQFEDGNGNPAVGYKMFFYAAGSSTKQNTYTDSTGNTANSNPIILNALGQPATEIWFTEGLTYKVVFAPPADTDPPAAAIWTIDNLKGINDTTLTIDQWVASGITPTYVSATQFTLPGDQTSAFTVNRRIKATVTAGTVYAGITVSAYGALTTVTLDSAVLDSGLSAVSLGLVTPDNTSLPTLPDNVFKVSGSTDLTKGARIEVDGLTTATTRTLTVQDKDLTIAGLDDILYSVSNAPQVRQTVLSGPVDTSGLPSFGGSTGSTTVTASGTLIATAANGTLNRTGSILNPAWTGLSSNGTMYLYLDIAADGTCTTGSTTVAPNYRWGGADVTTNNQFTFNIQEMVGKVGNGSVAAQTYRVFVGEVTVASNIVSAIIWYALMGRYDSGYTNTLPGTGTRTTFTHNIGIDPANKNLKLRCLTVDLGYSVGDTISGPGANSTAGQHYPMVITSNPKTIYFTTGGNSNFVFGTASSGVAQSPTAANWAYRVTCDRGW